MRDTRYIITLLMLLLCVSAAFAQEYTPRIAYVYPSGGQRGKTVRVVVAGQYLGGIKGVQVSGGGVTVTNVVRMRSYNNLNSEQRYILADEMLKNIERNLQAESVPGEQVEKFRKAILRQYPWSILKREDLDLEGETLPDSPLFKDFDKKNIRELMHVKTLLSIPRAKLQINRQLAEPVMMDFKIDSDAEPGERTVRLLTSKGLTNPLVFKVGSTKEVLEYEPNDKEAFQVPWEMNHVSSVMSGTAQEVPCVFNGQIMPGDVDRFRFSASKGQQLLIEAEARRLVPYLADAVPGWFQAVIALYDSSGNEIAYADDHYINPDPVTSLKVPETGEYEIEIRDSIYRGREDFVYRISVTPSAALVKELADGDEYGDRWTRKAVLPAPLSIGDVIPADVAALPAGTDQGRNDRIERAQSVKIPLLLSGSISEPGDVDVFRVKLEDRQKLAVEVFGRRLGSPLDSFVKVTDKKGRIIAANDDFIVKENHLHIDELGLITHHADSRTLTEELDPGPYYIHVSDTRGHGGSRYGYRVRISEPMPGFILRATPSVLYTRLNDCAPVKVYVARRDGYDGPIDIEVKDAEERFVMRGSTIPAGALSGVMTLQGVKKGTGKPVDIELAGKADVEGRIVTAPVLPAERIMQAFLFEHLVPAANMTCTVKKEKWGGPKLKRLAPEAVSLFPGESVTMRYELSWDPKETEIDLTLEDAPDGLEIDKKPRREGKIFEFDVRAGMDMKPLNRNILISAWGSRMVKPKNGGAERLSRWRIRTLAAFPVEIKASEVATAKQP